MESSSRGEGFLFGLQVWNVECILRQAQDDG